MSTRRYTRSLFLVGMMAALLLGGCGTEQAKEESTKPPSTEKQNATVVEDTTVTEEVKEEKVTIPEVYAAMVTISINPEFHLYLDVDNVVLACIGVNEDAKEMLEAKQAEFEGKSLNHAVQIIVEGSIDQGLLTEEKGNTVSIEMTEVVDENYSIQENLAQAQESAKVVMEDRQLTNAVETSLQESVQEVLDAQVCPDCGGTGFTCPNCGKHEWESCVCCKGTGYETCTNCRGSKLQTCPGCKGAGTDATDGSTCRYCNGSGGSTCEVCNGAGGYQCSRCYGFTYACPDCEFAVEYCKNCH